MAGKTAILKVSIIGDASKAEAALADTQTATEKFQSGLDRAAVGAGIALAGITAYAGSLWNAGEAAGTSSARIEQIAEQMGYAGDQAGELTDRLVDSAEAMALNTGMDPNVIKQGQATLLTFSELASSADEAGGAFDRANALAVDLSAAGFGSVESAATMLGKALQDPITGVSALRRVGVNLSDAQMEQIERFTELGDTAAAQAVVLEAVEGQVGGVAEATANSSDQMAVKWQLVQEELGQKLMPLFDKFAEVASGAMDFVAEHSDVLLVIGGVVAGIAAGILALAFAVKMYTLAQQIQTAIQWAQNAAWLASPVTWIVLAVLALIAAVILLWMHWDEVWAWMQEAAAAVAQWWLDTWDGIAEWWNGLLAGIAEWWNTLWGETVPAAIDMAVGWITDAWNGYWSWWGDALGAAGDWWNELWSGAGDFIGGIVDGIASVWQGLVDWFFDAWASVGDFIAGIFGGINDAIAGAADWIGGVLGFSVDAQLDASSATIGDGIPAYMRFGSPLGALATQAAPDIRRVRPSSAALEQHITNIEVNVDGALDATSVARQIRDIFKRGQIVGAI